MTRHLVDVFSTMLSMHAELRPDMVSPNFESRVTGSVGFAGENVNGAIYLHLPAPFANVVAAAMLGLKPEEISDDNEVNDVVGEATNMVTGGLKSWLCDAGAECAMSTPAIIRGKSFAIEPMPDVARESLVFAVDKNFIVVEIHIKLN
jgi:chemotaxis protein CheX